VLFLSDYNQNIKVLTNFASNFPRLTFHVKLYLHNFL